MIEKVLELWKTLMCLTCGRGVLTLARQREVGPWSLVARTLPSFSKRSDGRSLSGRSPHDLNVDTRTDGARRPWRLGLVRAQHGLAGPDDQERKVGVGPVEGSFATRSLRLFFGNVDPSSVCDVGVPKVSAVCGCVEVL